MAGKPIQRAVAQKLTKLGESEVFDAYLEQRSVPRMLKSLVPKVGKISKGMFYTWLHSDPDRWSRWQENKRTLAHELTEETLILPDKAADDPSSVPGARLPGETRRWIASRYNKDDYGKNPQTLVGINIGGDFLAALKEVEKDSAIDEADFEVIESEED